MWIAPLLWVVCCAALAGLPWLNRVLSGERGLLEREQTESPDGGREVPPSRSESPFDWADWDWEDGKERAG